MAAGIGWISPFEVISHRGGCQQLDRMEMLLLNAAETDATRVEPHISLANVYSTASSKKLELAEKHARTGQRHGSPPKKAQACSVDSTT